MKSCEPTIKVHKVNYLQRGLLTDWDVAEQAALAHLVLAIDLLICNIVKVVLLEAMAAEALTSRSDSFAISSCLHVAPIDIQPVGTLLSDLDFVPLKLGFTHHLAAVIDANDLLILKVSLDMFSRLAIHM